MPEVPEIASRASELNTAIVGKTISGIEIRQSKCLNVLSDEFIASLLGATIQTVGYHGKWIQAKTTQGWLLLNFGMGGDIFLVPPVDLPDKWVAAFHFTDNTSLTLRFWWFGHIHFVADNALHTHPMTAKLGPNVLDVSLDDFRLMVASQHTAVKSFLLDQSKIAGIGNAYIHDILFLARIHPLCRLDTLSPADIDTLYAAIQNGLRPSLAKNGAFYEKDIYGHEGGFGMDEILVGYRENQPCPECGTPITKIKTGATSSYICPKHQSLDSPKIPV